MNLIETLTKKIKEDACKLNIENYEAPVYNSFSKQNEKLNATTIADKLSKILTNLPTETQEKLEGLIEDIKEGKAQSEYINEMLYNQTDDMYSAAGLMNGLRIIYKNAYEKIQKDYNESEKNYQNEKENREKAEIKNNTFLSNLDELLKQTKDWIKPEVELTKEQIDELTQ